MVVKFNYWKGFPCLCLNNNTCLLNSNFSCLFMAFIFKLYFPSIFIFFSIIFYEIYRWNGISFKLNVEYFFKFIYFLIHFFLWKPCLVLCTHWCIRNRFSCLNSTLSLLHMLNDLGDSLSQFMYDLNRL